MSPRSADPAVRTALVEAAARVLAAEGPQALSSRRLASEVGTSTMAVYTHFGTMDGVRRAIRHQGFARLSADLEALARTGDPVADLAAVGAHYFAHGLDCPELYRAMFVDRPPDDDDDAGAALFQLLVDVVCRCIDAGRFGPAEPSLATVWAAEIWTMHHGMVTLAFTGLLPTHQIRFLLTDMAYRLFIGYGDGPETAKRSIDKGSANPPRVGHAHADHG
jgi:AcrR family transcriptional regulator